MEYSRERIVSREAIYKRRTKNIWMRRPFMEFWILCSGIQPHTDTHTLCLSTWVIIDPLIAYWAQYTAHPQCRHNEASVATSTPLYIIRCFGRTRTWTRTAGASSGGVQCVRLCVCVFIIKHVFASTNNNQHPPTTLRMQNGVKLRLHLGNYYLTTSVCGMHQIHAI